MRKPLARTAGLAPITSVQRPSRERDAVLALQRRAGNRTVTRLVRNAARGTPPASPSTRRLDRGPPAVPGGVETKVVSPAVRSLLDSKQIPFAREVEFELLDPAGTPVLKGRFDVVFRNPTTNELVFPELKGDNLQALTKGQKVYVPQFESPQGAKVRITSRGTGKLYLPTGTEEHVHGNNFMRVGSKNLGDFTNLVEQMASGQRVTNVYLGPDGLKSFTSQEAFEAFLAENQIAVSTPEAAKPAPPVDKPLKPPAPPTGARPRDPLHDPPARQTPPSTADPTAGPPTDHPRRKTPNPKPAPHDPDKPYRPPPDPKPKPPATTSTAKPEPAKPATEPATKPTTGAGATEAGVAGAAERASIGEFVGATLESLVEGWLLTIVVFGVIKAAKAFVFHEKGVETDEQRKLRELFGAKVTPSLTKELQARARQLHKTAVDHPDRILYANVTVDLTLTWENEGDDLIVVYTDKAITDLKFVGLETSFKSLSSEHEGEQDEDYSDHYTQTNRIVYSVELNPLGLSPELHHWVALVYQAGIAVNHGMSARQLATGMHWVGQGVAPLGREWTPADDREEARRKKSGLASWRGEVELQEQKLVVQAYLDYTGDHISENGVKAKHDDAIRYLDELDHLPPPADGCQLCKPTTPTLGPRQKSIFEP
jgi:hypothetical protein